MPSKCLTSAVCAALTVSLFAGLPQAVFSTQPGKPISSHLSRQANAPATTTKPSDGLGQAAALFRQGKYNEAIKLYDVAIESRKSADSAVQKTHVEALLGLGRALNAKEDYQGAVSALTKAAAIADAFDMPAELRELIKADLALVSGKVQGNSTRAIRHYSSYSRSSDQYDAAEEEFLKKASIEFTRNRFGPTSVSYLSRNIDYAKYLARQHRPDDVSRLAVTINDIFAKLDPDSQAFVAPQMLEMAQNLADNNYPLQADMMGSAVVKAVNSVAWKNVPDLASRINGVATAMERHQNGELAQKYYAAAVTAFEKTTKPDDPQLAKMRASLAQFYRKAGKNGAALELLELAAAAQLKNSPSGSAESIQTLAQLTDAYAMTGNFQKAKDSGEKLADALRINASDAPIPFKALIDTSGFIATRGDVPTAEKLYTAAVMSLRNNRDQRVSDYEIQNELKALATRFASLGLGDQAERVYDTLIQARQNASGQPTSHSISAYVDKAQYLLEQDSMPKVKETLDKAIELSARFPQHRERLGDIARQMQEKKEYDYALKLLQISLDENDTHRGTQVLTDVKTRMATLYALKGDNAEATRIFKETSTQAMDRMPNRLAPARPALQVAIDKLVAQGKFQQASEILNNIENSVHHSHQGDALSRMAYVLVPLEMSAEAEEILSLALAMQSEAFGPSSLQAGSVMRQRAQILQSLGKGKQAQELFEADRAIQALYQKQHQVNANGTAIFNPFAPLAETVTAYRNQNKEHNPEQQSSGTGFNINSIRVPR